MSSMYLIYGTWKVSSSQPFKVWKSIFPKREHSPIPLPSAVDGISPFLSLLSQMLRVITWIVLTYQPKAYHKKSVCISFVRENVCGLSKSVRLKHMLGSLDLVHQIIEVKHCLICNTALAYELVLILTWLTIKMWTYCNAVADIIVCFTTTTTAHMPVAR